LDRFRCWSIATSDRSAAGQSPKPDDRSEVAAWHPHSRRRRRMSAYADRRMSAYADGRVIKCPNATKLPIWGRTSTTLSSATAEFGARSPMADAS